MPYAHRAEIGLLFGPTGLNPAFNQMRTAKCDPQPQGIFEPHPVYEERLAEHIFKQWQRGCDVIRPKPRTKWLIKSGSITMPQNGTCMTGKVPPENKLYRFGALAPQWTGHMPVFCFKFSQFCCTDKPCKWLGHRQFKVIDRSNMAKRQAPTWFFMRMTIKPKHRKSRGARTLSSRCHQIKEQ